MKLTLESEITHKSVKNTFDAVGCDGRVEIGETSYRALKTMLEKPNTTSSLRTPYMQTFLANVKHKDTIHLFANFVQNRAIISILDNPVTSADTLLLLAEKLLLSLGDMTYFYERLATHQNANDAIANFLLDQYNTLPYGVIRSLASAPYLSSSSVRRIARCADEEIGIELIENPILSGEIIEELVLGSSSFPFPNFPPVWGMGSTLLRSFYNHLELSAVKHPNVLASTLSALYTTSSKDATHKAILRKTILDNPKFTKEMAFVADMME